jgi:hypothetical protein
MVKPTDKSSRAPFKEPGKMLNEPTAVAKDLFGGWNVMGNGLFRLQLRKELFHIADIE